MCATQSKPQSPASRRGFPDLVCIKCGDDSNTVRVSLADTSEFVCDCGAEFTAEDVRQFLAAWQKVLAWIDLAPAIEE
jgi:hypothetical protein